MLIVFLDFDGVLNDRAYRAADPSAYTAQPLQSKYVARLNEIVNATRARVVLCTDWRADGLAACRRWLDKAGSIAQVIGRTPELDYELPRWHEIAAWLKGKSNIDGFVILDDLPDMGPLQARHIAPRDGLIETDTQRAIAILHQQARAA